MSANTSRLCIRSLVSADREMEAVISTGRINVGNRLAATGILESPMSSLIVTTDPNIFRHIVSLIGDNTELYTMYIKIYIYHLVNNHRSYIAVIAECIRQTPDIFHDLLRRHGHGQPEMVLRLIRDSRDLTPYIIRGIIDVLGELNTRTPEMMPRGVADDIFLYYLNIGVDPYTFMWGNMDLLVKYGYPAPVRISSKHNILALFDDQSSLVISNVYPYIKQLASNLGYDLGDILKLALRGYTNTPDTRIVLHMAQKDLLEDRFASIVRQYLDTVQDSNLTNCSEHISRYISGYVDILYDFYYLTYRSEGEAGGTSVDTAHTTRNDTRNDTRHITDVVSEESQMPVKRGEKNVANELSGKLPRDIPVEWSQLWLRSIQEDIEGNPDGILGVDNTSNPNKPYVRAQGSARGLIPNNENLFHLTKPLRRSEYDNSTYPQHPQHPQRQSSTIMKMIRGHIEGLKSYYGLLSIASYNKMIKMWVTSVIILVDDPDIRYMSGVKLVGEVFTKAISAGNDTLVMEIIDVEDELIHDQTFIDGGYVIDGMMLKDAIQCTSHIEDSTVSIIVSKFPTIHKQYTTEMMTKYLIKCKLFILANYISVTGVTPNINISAATRLIELESQTDDDIINLLSFIRTRYPDQLSEISFQGWVTAPVIRELSNHGILRNVLNRPRMTSKDKLLIPKDLEAARMYYINAFDLKDNWMYKTVSSSTDAQTVFNKMIGKGKLDVILYLQGMEVFDGANVSTVSLNSEDSAMISYLISNTLDSNTSLQEMIYTFHKQYYDANV